MSDKKKIMIIAHFCDYGNENTNNRFNYLADYISRCGYDVELVTSSFSHRDKIQRQKVKNTENTYRSTLIYEPGYRKNISLKRLFWSHRIIAKNLKKYLEHCETPDLVYCAIPSIDISEVAGRYAKKKGIPFVIDVQDLWPEAYRLILKNERLYRMVTAPMEKRVNDVYYLADQIVAVSDTYAQRAKAANKKKNSPITVYLGTEASTFDQAVKQNTPPYCKPDKEFWIGYCGTLGHSYDLTVIMLALKKLLDEGVRSIRFIIMGCGPLQKKIKAMSEKLGIACTFTGKLTYELMCAQLCECDIAVNPIAKGAMQSIINKHADYAMSGIPVLSTQENEEYKKLLNQYHSGISCKPDSINDIAYGIKWFIDNKEKRLEMGRNARKMGMEKFDRFRNYRKIADVVQKCCL